MTSKTLAIFLSTLMFFTVADAQSGGMMVVMGDGSVRNTLQVDTEFPLATDPGRVRVQIGRLPATTLEECMASTDFSSAKAMSPRDYFASYNAATATMSFGFGVEREMKEDGAEGLRSAPPNCHIVRFASGTSTDGRDFLIWQKDGAINFSAEAILDPNNAAALMQDGSVRFIQHSISRGF